MKKPKSAKPPKAGTAAKAKPWAPVPVGLQRWQHHLAVRKWKPVPVSVQRKQHQVAVKAARARAKSKVRKLALGEGVACCSAQAVGTLLGLSDDEVLALYRLTAGGPDDGASIQDTLEVAGLTPTALSPVHRVLQCSAFSARTEPALFGPDRRRHYDAVQASQKVFILGLELPEGPHAVLASEGGWWSWGELYDPADFPGAVVEEAWAVTWRP